MNEIWTINKEKSGFKNNCGLFPLLIFVESDQGKKIKLFFNHTDICDHFRDYEVKPEDFSSKDFRKNT